MEQKQRILYWDVIKAFAIFLVVWGHCLQYLQVNTERCWESNLCGFIYSFHMPLFMMVSGYFARGIYRKSILENLKHKTIQVLLPSVTTYIVVGLLLIYARHEPWGYGLAKLGVNCLTSYWFLKALYILYVVGILFTSLYRKSKYFAYTATMLLVLLLRNNVEFVHTMSMLPFFLVGMLLYKYENQFWSKQVAVISICILACGVLAFKYDIVDYNMYMHPFQFESRYLYLFAVRTLMGVCASLLCIIVIRNLCNWLKNGIAVRSLAKMGGMTLGIYVYHRELTLLANRFASRVESLNLLGQTTEGGYLFYEYVVCSIAALLFTFISIAIIKILRRNKYSRLIFLGEK